MFCFLNRYPYGCGTGSWCRNGCAAGNFQNAGCGNSDCRNSCGNFNGGYDGGFRPCERISRCRCYEQGYRRGYEEGFDRGYREASDSDCGSHGCSGFRGDLCSSCGSSDS